MVRAARPASLLAALLVLAPLAAARGAEDAQAYYRRAISRYLQGDRDGAIAEARRSVAVGGGGHADAERLLRVLARDDLATVEPAISVEPDLALEHGRQAMRSYLAGDLAGAESSARRAVARDPGDLLAVRLLDRLAQRPVPSGGDPYRAIFGERGRRAKVTGDFRRERLSTALAMLTRSAAMPVIVSGEGDPAVTVRFRDVTAPEALKAVLDAAAYTLGEEGGAVMARPYDPAKVESRIYRLQNLILQDGILTGTQTQANAQASRQQAAGEARTEEALETVKGVLSAQGKLSYDSTSRTLVATDTVENLAAVERLLKTLDRLPPQILIRARVVEIRNNDLLNLGFDWDLDYNLLMTSASRPTTFPFFKAFDPITGIRPETDPASSDFSPLRPDGGKHVFPYATAQDFKFGTLSGGDFGVNLHLTDILSKAEILSAPRVIVQEGKRAEIQVGERVPIPTTAIDSQTGQVNVTGFDEERVGILLEVIPHVLENGNIRLSVHPEVSTIGEWIGKEPVLRPIINTREVTTQVVVANGSTLVIGGLISDQDSETVKQIPFLHRIPLLGKLFRNRNDDQQKTEVVIFMTVNLVGPSTPLEDSERKAFDIRSGSPEADRK